MRFRLSWAVRLLTWAPVPHSGRLRPNREVPTSPRQAGLARHRPAYTFRLEPGRPASASSMHATIVEVRNAMIAMILMHDSVGPRPALDCVERAVEASNDHLSDQRQGSAGALESVPRGRPIEVTACSAFTPSDALVCKRALPGAAGASSPQPTPSGATSNSAGR
jgi:hypothetical protein